MTRREAAAWVSLVSVLVASGSGVAQSALRSLTVGRVSNSPEGVFRDEGGKRWRIVAGTIRNEGAGWFVLQDDRHRPVNLAVGPTEKQAVRLVYPANCGVGSLVVVPDETMASRGYSAGSSVGARGADVRIVRQVGGRTLSVDPASVVSAAGNLWVMGVFPVDDCAQERGDSVTARPAQDVRQ